MVENVIQNKSGILIDVDESVKNIIYINKNYYLAKCSCCSKTVPRHIIYETKRFYIYSPFY